MDQPQQPSNHGISWEWIIASFLTAVAGLGSLWAKNKIKIDNMRERVKIESAPVIEKEYIEEHARITQSWEKEVDKLRAQIDRVREEGRQEAKDSRAEATEWMKRALLCESRVPALVAEIETLKERVKSLEEQLKKGQGNSLDADGRCGQCENPPGGIHGITVNEHASGPPKIAEATVRHGHHQHCPGEHRPLAAQERSDETRGWLEGPAVSSRVGRTLGGGVFPAEAMLELCRFQPVGRFESSL